jgi:hypothetical protein
MAQCRVYYIKLHISVSSAENVVLRPVVTVSVPEFSQLRLCSLAGRYDLIFSKSKEYSL